MHTPLFCAAGFIQPPPTQYTQRTSGAGPFIPSLPGQPRIWWPAMVSARRLASRQMWGFFVGRHPALDPGVGSAYRRGTMSARSKSQYQRSDSNGQSADPGDTSRAAARSLLRISVELIALCIAIGAAQAVFSWGR